MTVFDCYTECRQELSEGNRESARDLADLGIMKIAQAREEGMGVDDLIDDVRVGLWLERFWYFLENNNLMLDGELSYLTR